MDLKTAKETLPPVPGVTARLADYDKTYRTFDWKSIEAAFSWHRTGRVNMAHEAIDRHVVEGHGDRAALLYTDGVHTTSYTFADLMRLSNRFANALVRLGVTRGDRVFVFLPPVPEAAIGMLGILKVGAVPSPLSGACRTDAVRERMQDAAAVALLTHHELLTRVPEADLPDLRNILVVGPSVAAGRHRAFDAEMEASSDAFDPVWLGREDPLILHYTSGATGKPKGALHVQNAMLGHLQTGRWVLDLNEADTYWCTADPGSVNGTSNGFFAPWLNGATRVMFGGRPDAGAWYRTIETLQVTVWDSSPSEWRGLMRAGAAAAAMHDLASLRHVLSSGEPLSAEIVRWGQDVLGRRIHDHWLMAETGHALIANYPSMEIRPGSMGKAIPGVEAAIFDEDGRRVPPNTLGLLCIKAGWPGMMRQVWRDPARFRDYFRFSGWYFSGDTAICDENGYFWFQGRADELLPADGERVSPFEVESVLASHPAVADAGVIGRPDPVYGHKIKAFIVLRAGFEPSATLRNEIFAHAKARLASHAVPREITFHSTLPRDRAGKMGRRALKAWDHGSRGGPRDAV